MAERPLSDVTALELTTGVAGPYAGKLLAILGARVLKVEPPGGDPCRQEPPLVGGESAFFNWLNADKRGLQFPLDDARLEALAGAATIVLHDAHGEEADALEARLVAANPAAVVVSITPYGRWGPRAAWQASPLTEWATSGYHYIAGDPAREPLALPGYQAEFHAGLHAAVGALGGLWHATGTGQGQRIEVSHQEACLSDHSWLIGWWTHQGKVQTRTGSLFVPCADGWIFLFNLVPYPNLFVLMERFDLLEDTELLNPLNYMHRFAQDVLPVFMAWAATRTKQEIYHACQELRIAATPVQTMKDVAEHAQLHARQWFTEVEAGGQRFQAPGFPFAFTGTPCETTGRAPAPGADNARIAELGAAAPTTLPRANTPFGLDRSLPLAGVRLIEVTANWAGPIGGRHLADLGADVIKIELATKPATRALAYIADDMWPRHYHRSAYFNKLNRNKRAICLDLSKPEGKRVFLDLVKHADAVLENNSARVMTNLGLNYEALAQVNPRLVMVSMAGFGGTGPEKDYSAYGSNIETMSGLASVLGYDDRQYFGTGTFYADPVTGNHGAVALLAALHQARRSGRGQWVDMSLLEAAVPFFAQQFLTYTVTGDIPGPKGNDAWGNLYEAVVPSFGRDCWLAVTLRDEADVAKAGAALGVALDPADRPGIDAAVRAFAAARDHITAADALQAEGVAAAPVMPNWQLFMDNHLNDRDFFVRVRHADAGTQWFSGFPWRFERTPARVRMAAPMFAEHNREVFGTLLGMSEEEIRAIYEAGATADVPQFAGGL